MDHALIQTLTQKQKLSLTPQLQTALKILQANNTALVQLLNNAALENPFLTVHSPAIPMSNIVKPDFNYPDRSTFSLETTLRNQISFMPDNSQKQLLIQLIYQLDDHGYLPDSLESLSQRLSVSKTALIKAIAQLQTLDPAGIGARSLAECLSLQLQRRSDTQLAQAMLALDPSILQQHDWSSAARLLNVSISKIQMAFAQLQQLSPNPVAVFDQDTPFNQPYLFPELQVHCRQQQPIVTLIDQDFPELKFDQRYFQTLQSQTFQDQTVTQYLKKQLQDYQWLVQSLARRKTTLLQVAQIIVQYQSAFFTNCQHPLQNLTLKTIAAESAHSESTISRTIQGKTILTDEGIRPLRSFLKNSPQYSDHTVTQVKTLIQALILQEDRQKPLSDQSIADLLQTKQIQIARRTVTKYRLQLAIASAQQRKLRR
ncbi:RNA polymerase factor sigma-54 [Agrilactobacillus yilanensis]|uniref:RNA polymerase factor sigma-54 n=1 Tax=Agrilactobacillus yilanensis TaxID=2485997 RepID=A0ABW4J445_9LACO|nr:RNA polymerase factor sigma-54 [Agrilactobacillus yilanensis]